MAATNRPWDLDPALIRAGRFDAIVHVPLPPMAARKDILRIHCNEMCLSDDVDLGVLAAETHLFSGAELRSICIEAVSNAKRRSSECVCTSDFRKVLSETYPAMSEVVNARYLAWNSSDNEVSTSLCDESPLDLVEQRHIRCN